MVREVRPHFLGQLLDPVLEALRLFLRVLELAGVRQLAQLGLDRVTGHAQRLVDKFGGFLRGCHFWISARTNLRTPNDVGLFTTTTTRYANSMRYAAKSAARPLPPGAHCRSCVTPCQ